MRIDNCVHIRSVFCKGFVLRRWLLFLLLFYNSSAYPIDNGNIKHFYKDVPEVRQPAVSQNVDPMGAIAALRDGRPTIGSGPTRITLVVDFDERESLQMLNNLIALAKKDHKISVTILYYTTTSRDKTAAIFSSIVYMAVNHRQHATYLEKLTAIHGHNANALIKSVKAAHIDPRRILRSAKTLEEKSNDQLRQNNEGINAIMHIKRAPAMVIGSKVIIGYVPKKKIVSVINTAITQSNTHTLSRLRKQVVQDG